MNLGEPKDRQKEDSILTVEEEEELVRDLNEVNQRVKKYNYSHKLTFFGSDNKYNELLGNLKSLNKATLHKTMTGWPHSSRDKIPCVFPEFSLCYNLFPCVFFHKINIWF